MIDGAAYRSVGKRHMIWVMRP